MQPFERFPTNDPAAWTNRTLGGSAKLRYELSADEIDALQVILAKTRLLAPHATTSADFEHPSLNNFYSEIRYELMHGHGAVVVAGITPEQFSAEQFERIFWGIGTHLGIAAVQSAAGDKIGHVRVTDNPKNRGYLSSRELDFHSDAFELMGLMCVERAEQGGLTRLVSGLAIHNEILKNRPDLLHSLYEGYHYAIAEAVQEMRPVTPYKIPIFSNVAGQVSCMCIVGYMAAAAARMSTELPVDLAEALKLLLETAERSDLKVEFLLTPGEILLCNNFALLHARSPFVNSANRERHMLRLWLKVPDGRPVVPALLERGAEYERIHTGENRD